MWRETVLSDSSSSQLGRTLPTNDRRRAFIIKNEYLHAFRYADTVERDGLTMTFHSQHRPLESYFMALKESGLLVETLREPGIPEHAIVSEAARRWQRVTLFLHLRVRRL
jgi:hypothetical protein